MSNETLPDLIRRSRNGRSYRQLVEESNGAFTRPALTSWEKGLSRPSKSNRTHLARVLGVSLDEVEAAFKITPKAPKPPVIEEFALLSEDNQRAVRHYVSELLVRQQEMEELREGLERSQADWLETARRLSRDQRKHG